MGVIRQGPPAAIVMHLKARYNVPAFIETGTYLGTTARWASQHFQHVYTIEFAQAIYQQALAAHGQVKNIAFLYGHTREQLAQVVEKLAAPSIFWLDAHWSAGATYGAQDECPVLDEIAIIQGARHEHFILIDDARLFLAPPPEPHRPDQWPDLTALMNRLNAHGQRYTVVLEDVIISAPAAAQEHLRAFFQEYVTQQSRQTFVGQPAAGRFSRAKQLVRRSVARLRPKRV